MKTIDANKATSVKNDINYESSLTRTYQLEANKAYLITVFPYDSGNVVINGYNLGIYFVFTGHSNGNTSQVIPIFETSSLSLSVGTDLILSITSGYRYMHYSITKL
jgi:hypothetical protein